MMTGFRGPRDFLHGIKALSYPITLKDDFSAITHSDLFDASGTLDSTSYQADEDLQSLLEFIDHQITAYRFLDLPRFILEGIARIFEELRHPDEVGSKDYFISLGETYCKMIRQMNDEVEKKISLLSCEECMRLDEALVCFQTHCYYASVIMAVSALEIRLHRLMKKADARLYKQEVANSTLGVIIDLMDPSKYKDPKYRKIKSIVPKRHSPLISLLNQYRILSVHPKKEEITAQIAEAVLHLTFTFMLDPSLCPYGKEELVCGSRSKKPSKKNKGKKVAEKLREAKEIIGE